MKHVSTESQINRHTMGLMKTKLVTDKKRQCLVDQQQRMRSLIQGCLSRDDNSRVVPYTPDVKKQDDGSMLPKRTLD